jgi:hypothetical protein
MHGLMAISAVSGVANTHAVQQDEPHDPPAKRMKEHAKHVEADEKPAEIEQAPDGDNHIHVVA